ncbi:MAG: right-handed parallel beta-helix repeat-containing protein [Steroidobacteraceae bacterium]|nr:right-handed parallel beta-helix repeat-containing protein [Steroidobacteraceae bacterium]
MATPLLPTRRGLSVAAVIALLSAAQCAVAAESSRESGATVHVAVNGTDDKSCGSRSNPCRSITQAIKVARDGATVLVGPGRYGDADATANLAGPGDEHPDASLECMICIDKRVRVLSTNGPEQTSIQEADVTVGALVLIRADGVTFGKRDQGFTIYGRANRVPGQEGAAVGIAVQDASDVRVEGNVVTAVTGAAFRLDGSDGPIRVSRNLAISNQGPGFIVTGTNAGRVWLLRNSAVANRGEGFRIEGPHLVVANVANTNLLDGFVISGSGGEYFHDVSLNHLGGDGFRVEGSNHLFTRIATHGNFFGIRFVAGEGNEVHGSNIYGNRGNEGRRQMRCGVLNASRATVVATGNYWGARTGPGEYPADQAGKVPECDVQDGSRTVFAPFASEPFVVIP